MAGTHVVSHDWTVERNKVKDTVTVADDDGPVVGAKVNYAITAYTPATGKFGPWTYGDGTLDASGQVTTKAVTVKSGDICEIYFQKVEGTDYNQTTDPQGHARFIVP